ncbi:thymine dioxygenase [Xylariales sp. PMI_506]|nr:thymine dioxygenase [Xylariales sp. PMI_506]
MDCETNAIPIVDFGAWSSGSPEATQHIARELTEACRKVGFVYVTNHGLPRELVDEAFSWSKRLFDLPKEKKMLAPHPPGPSVHRGYSWPGLEKVSQRVHLEGEDPDAEEAELRKIGDYKESYEIGNEAFELQPNVWLPEDILPGFRSFTTEFYWRCFDIAKNLLRALAVGLGLNDDDFFLRFHSGLNNQLRLLHYPPVDTEKLTSQTLARMPTHSDWGTITILFQDECGGLQVEDPNQNGCFMDATPVKDALIMNVGDLLMRWSNDYLTSTLHRVNTPPMQRHQVLAEARYSIPYFISPDPDSVIEVLPQCSDMNNPPRYSPITQAEYGRMRGRLHYSDKMVDDQTE